MSWLQAVAIGALLGGDIEAQVVVGGDTIPKFGFALNRAAIAVGRRPLRKAALPAGEREVRIWTVGPGMPNASYHVRTSGGRVRGGVILFWAHISEWKPTGNRESMHAYVRRVFPCGPIRRQDYIEACDADLTGHRPDWRRVLARMDSLGVGTLRTPPNNPQPTDAFVIGVETRDGSKYNTAYFVMPSATGPGGTPRAYAILELLNPILEKAMRDSTSSRR